MVKVRLKTEEELKKIEEFLADAATDMAIKAKDKYQDLIQQNMLSFQLIKMCESVTESLGKNVLVNGREPRSIVEASDSHGNENKREEELRKQEQRKLRELLLDPELDDLENEVAELTQKVAEQRALGPSMVLKNLEKKLAKEREMNDRMQEKWFAQIEREDLEEDGTTTNNTNVLKKKNILAHISDESLEETKRKLEKSLEAMPGVHERLRKALEKLASLTNEIDNQRTRAPPGTIERAIDAAPVFGFDDDAYTTEEATALRSKNETRRRLARELRGLGK
jgi:hypothetical protein